MLIRPCTKKTLEKTMSQYSYEIVARSTRLGGGWDLLLFRDDQKVGQIPFPATTPHERIEAFEAAEQEAEIWLTDYRGEWIMEN
jgi:hypothetical protein